MKCRRYFNRVTVFLTVLLSVSLLASAAQNSTLEAALKTAQWIKSSALNTPQGTAWPADPADPKTVNNSLYAGTPGVILFFLEAYNLTGKKDLLQEAQKGADYLLSTWAEEKNTGLYEGISGVGFALEEAYKITGESKYRNGFLACLRQIKDEVKPAGKGVEWGTVTDIISGNAGTGLFLIYASHELKDQSWLELAEKAGTRLIELGKPEQGGLKWAMDPSFPRLMPNFSHGTAGIAYFLAALFEETKKKEFLDAALAGANYLVKVAKTEGDVCLIFHNEPDGKDMYYLGWCHGPVGTAQLFYRLFRITKDNSWMDWLRRSARGVLDSGIPEKQTPGFWNNDGICCGLAGVGDFFLNLYRVTKDKSYLDFCKRVTDRLLAKATVEGDKMKWIQAEHRAKPDLLIAQTGLMQGASGIGLFLLHLDALERGKPRLVLFLDSPF